MAADLPHPQPPQVPRAIAGDIPGAGPTHFKRRYQNLRTITALILREMSSKYGRSPGGYIWAVLEPIMMIMVLSVAFSFLFRTPSLGTNFILFYATGIMPYRMFQECQSVTSGAISYSKALLAYPVVSVADAVLARMILAVMTQLMVSYLILTGVIMLLDVQLVLDFGPIVTAFALAAILGFGVGTLNSVLFAFFPIYKSLYSAATRPLLILSAVIYIYEDLPEIAQAVLWYNPLIHLTGLSRTGYYSYYEPTYIMVTYVAAVGLIVLMFGILLLRRYYRQMLTV